MGNAPTGSRNRAETARRTVLLVDDDPGIRLICRVNLELEGFETREASTREEALDLLAREAIGLVFLDVRLGDSDGLDLAAQIRADHPEVPLVAVTGMVPSSGELDAYFDEVLGKPFDLAELADAARRLCRGGASRP